MNRRVYQIVSIKRCNLINISTDKLDIIKGVAEEEKREEKRRREEKKKHQI